MLIDVRRVNLWLNPWPAKIDKGPFQFKVESLNKAGRYYIFHGAEDDDPLTAKQYTTLVRRHILNPKKNPAPKGYEAHYIWMLCRDFAPAMQNLTIIVDQYRGRQRIVDGNHRLLALLLSGRLHQTMKITHVGVLLQC